MSTHALSLARIEQFIHGESGATADETKAMASELRDLRRVARAASRLVTRFREGQYVRDTTDFSLLEATLSMAAETSPVLRVGGAGGGE